MATAASFYAAMMAWLSLNDLTNFKLSGVMEQHRDGGIRQFSASIVPDTPQNSTIEEPEKFGDIFKTGSPEGFELVDIVTGQLYSPNVVLKPNWRIQLTYISADDATEKTPDRPRRSFDRPNVELSPGTGKMAPTAFPPNYLQMKLRYLMKLKEKRANSTITFKNKS